MERQQRRSVLAGLGAGALAAATAGTAGAGGQDGRDETINSWIERHAVPLASADPSAPPDDLHPLIAMLSSADVVGLGEATHGSRELFQIKHRLVRFLVERLGVRTVAFEEDFAGGVVLDRYILAGEGDPHEAVAQMSSPFWASEEILDLVRWMRAYNLAHDDKVRFLGTDVTVLRELSFEALTDYVRRVAPDQLGELEHHLAPIRPRGSRLEHLQWYFQQPDGEKQALIESARRASELVQRLPATGRGREVALEGEYARQHARTIVGWYVNYASELRPEREEFIADTITWWRRTIGGKIAYWAANVHTCAAPTATIRVAGETGNPIVWAGGHLRARLGRRYASIGTAFHEGTINSGYLPPAPHPIGPPPPGFLDATLGEARLPDYLLDLHAPATGPVRTWRREPATMRMIHPMYATGDDSAGYSLSVDSLIDAFDVLVHIRTTTPSRLLTWQPTG